MRILLVRHAEPDYARDSLTPKGRREAELLSRRLCRLDVKAFYVSPLGRAQDTAAYTLSKVNRTAETLPWLAEFRRTLLRCHGRRKPYSLGLSSPQWTACPELFDPRTWLESPLLAQGARPANLGGNCFRHGRPAGPARLPPGWPHLPLCRQPSRHAGVLLPLWHCHRVAQPPVRHSTRSPVAELLHASFFRDHASHPGAHQGRS